MRDSQNVFVIAALQHFERIIHTKPMLVFDRGFASPSIVQFLEQNQWKFIIRVKGGEHFWNPKRPHMVAARHVRKNDERVEAYGESLRLVVSDRKENAKEP